MERASQTRSIFSQKLFLVIVSTYFIPILYLVCRSSYLIPPGYTLQLLSSGLLITVLGSLTLLLFAAKWEEQLIEERTWISQTSPNSFLGEESSLSKDEKIELEEAVRKIKKEKEEIKNNLKKVQEEVIELKNEKNVQKKKSERVRMEIESSQQSHLEQVRALENDIEKKNKDLIDLQETVEQNIQLIKSQENKIRDLSYEVKTLLQLGTISESTEAQEIKKKSQTHPVLDLFREGDNSLDRAYQSLEISSNKNVETSYDATLQLQKYLEIAHQIKGAAHREGISSRFQELSINTSSIDLRRLFDTLHNESSSTIFLYSPKENKVLMTTQQVKSILGWTPEKFSSDFFNLIVEGKPEWNRTLQQLSTQSRAQVKLMLKKRGGEDTLVFCHLGKVAHGSFVDHFIGLIYPA